MCIPLIKQQIMKRLTSKEEEILGYFWAKGPLFVRELLDLQEEPKPHYNTLSTIVRTLEEKGYIRKDPTKPRAIEILDDEFNLARREVINVPIVGTVTCGEPILAEQNIQGYFPIPPEYLHANGKNTFMLKVKGDSMINAGIFDGDLVMCEEAQTARNAEMVVALIDDSATVKTYYKEAGYYRLQPENDTMDPIIVQDGELQILGKVIGLFRTF